MKNNDYLDNPEQPYRVCYRKSIQEPYIYKYFTSPREARRFWANKKQSGYFGCFQYWHCKELTWIG
jgi:hypothetical protein